MIVRSIARVHELVRDRMPGLTEEDVAAIAALVWNEAHAICRSGAGGKPLLDAMPTGPSDYRELVLG